MLAWQVPYLGWRHFPAELSEFEISRFFTFEPQVHRAIRSRYETVSRFSDVWRTSGPQLDEHVRATIDRHLPTLPIWTEVRG